MWGDEWLKVPPRYLIRGEGQGKYLLNVGRREHDCIIYQGLTIPITCRMYLDIN